MAGMRCTFQPFRSALAGQKIQAARPAAAAARSLHAAPIVCRSLEAGVGLYGTKAGMTQFFTADGQAYPATVIALEEGEQGGRPGWPVWLAWVDSRVLAAPALSCMSKVSALHA